MYLINHLAPENVNANSQNILRDASNDRRRLLGEVSNLLPLLVNLDNQVRLAKRPEPWFDCVRCLAIQNGPIDQLRESLEELTRKLKVSISAFLNTLVPIPSVQAFPEYCISSRHVYFSNCIPD